jgi:endonuclease-3 related protein
MKALLLRIYRRLLRAYGPQHWWPADSPFEVVVGAILTQSAAWVNVEKAIANLRAAHALSPEGIHRLSEEDLAHLIYPSGYYRQKARKLKAFVQHLVNEAHGDVDALWALPQGVLRQRLLSIHGIGPETADSIILYAAGKPIFVIDAYTRRIMARLGLAPLASRGRRTSGQAAATASYHELQALFMDNLPQDAQLFNEYHALLVRLAKEVCHKAQPRCASCPLRSLCPTGRSSPL